MAVATTNNLGHVVWQQSNMPWMLYCKPFRVAPHVYYIGTKWVGAYLIDGGSELAVIDTLVFECAYQLFENIRLLGFDPAKVTKILLTHCHVDHVGGVNPLKYMSGADIYMSKEDTAYMGTPANLEMGDEFIMVPFSPDQFFSDEEPIRVGNVVVRTKLTPGHTPGTTSFFIEDETESGEKLVCAVHGGVGVLTLKDSFLEKYHMDKSIRRRFIDDCDSMKEIHVDITLPSHPAHGEMMKHVDYENPDQYQAFINPSEWKEFLESRKGFAVQLENA